MRRRPVAALAAVLGMAIGLGACGDDDDGTADPASTATSEPVDASAPVDVSLEPAEPPASAPPVELPDEIPTELVVTELTAGSGREAAEGDTVVVNYVGVRSEDGAQFDSNFGGNPFPVVLGEGSVIPGWDQGLVGAQGGERLQLDIPAELAYGDTPRGDVIQAGDALTFVIDVLAVVPPTNPDDAPTDVSLPVSDTPTDELIIDDLVEGEGEAVDVGRTAVAHLVAARGDNGVVVQSTWEEGQPQALAVARGQMIDGLVDGLIGMRPGGRRVLTIPFEQAFGAGGLPQSGLPANTDLIVVIDLLAVF